MFSIRGMELANIVRVSSSSLACASFSATVSVDLAPGNSTNLDGGISSPSCSSLACCSRSASAACCSSNLACALAASCSLVTFNASMRCSSVLYAPGTSGAATPTRLAYSACSCLSALIWSITLRLSSLDKSFCFLTASKSAIRCAKSACTCCTSA